MTCAQDGSSSQGGSREVGSRDQIPDAFGRWRQVRFPDRLDVRCCRKRRISDPLEYVPGGKENTREGWAEKTNSVSPKGLCVLTITGIKKQCADGAFPWKSLYSLEVLSCSRKCSLDITRLTITARTVMLSLLVFFLPWGGWGKKSLRPLWKRHHCGIPFIPLQHGGGQPQPSLVKALAGYSGSPKP